MGRVFYSLDYFMSVFEVAFVDFDAGVKNVL